MRPPAAAAVCASAEAAMNATSISAKRVGFTATAGLYYARRRRSDEIWICTRGARRPRPHCCSRGGASLLRRRIRLHQTGDAHRQADEDGMDQPAWMDLHRRRRTRWQGRQRGDRSRQSERAHPPRSSSRGLHAWRNRRRQRLSGEKRHPDGQRHVGHTRERKELLPRFTRYRSAGGKAMKAPVVVALLLITAPAFAQEATLNGTISDQTNSVLPGATITAVHEASGNTFVATTDDRGFYRLPLRTGVYRLNAELAGFANVNRSVELLVGQQAVMNLQMAPSAVQESVTVTAEA